MEIRVQPIGVVRSRQKESRENGWGHVEAEIVLDGTRFSEDSLRGLEEFSHLEVIFLLHKIAEKEPVVGSRHPRGNVSWSKVGIFAQRGKDRPNHLGATICELISVHGTTIHVKGLDAYDGTPVLDIKPVMREFLPHREKIKQAKWVDELMKPYF